MDNIINNQQRRLGRLLHSRKPKTATLAQSKKLYRLVRYASLAGLGFIGLALVFPVCTSTSQALVLDHQDPKPATISLSLPSTSEIDITPQAGGQFGATSSKLQIESSSNSGYQVYVSTMDQTNAMVGTKGEIKALTSPSTSRSFLPNTWGYALGTVQAGPETEYQGLPLTPTIVHSTNQATAGTVDTYYLSFGTNLDTSLPAGQYTNNVVISVIANPQRITNLSELTYMQDMTSSICSNTKGADGAMSQDATGSYIVTPGNEVEKRLIDVRDGKEYWVSKLADGNCWMVQNLALDLISQANEHSPVTLPLKPESSDVTADWSPSDETEYQVPTATPVPTDLASRSWNFGNYVFKSPEATGNTCNIYTGSTYEKCPQYFTNVSSWQPDFTLTQKNGTFTPIDESAKTYDAHYLIGNHYQWTTATAGSSTTASGYSGLVDATNSICPKGWQLPKTAMSIGTGDILDRADSPYRLLHAYGYPNTAGYTSTTNQKGHVILTGIAGTGVSGPAYQRPTLTPLHLIRSGFVSPEEGLTYFAGTYGEVWTSTARAATPITAALEFNTTDGSVYPSFTSPVTTGFAVRCLAR